MHRCENINWSEMADCLVTGWLSALEAKLVPFITLFCLAVAFTACKHATTENKEAEGDTLTPQLYYLQDHPPNVFHDIM